MSTFDPFTDPDGHAPSCQRCHHLLVVHGAGKCGATGCDCPSDEYAWGLTDDPAIAAASTEQTEGE